MHHAGAAVRITQSHRAVAALYCGSLAGVPCGLSATIRPRSWRLLAALSFAEGRMCEKAERRTWSDAGRGQMIRAIIFDFDGLILDTEVPEFQSWQEIYQTHGCELPLALWAMAIGTS